MTSQQPPASEPSLTLPSAAGELPTEAQVLAFLRAHPQFFTDQPLAFSDLEIAHDPSGSTSSLLERQILVLRERVKALEHRLTDMVHHAQENDAIADRLMGWLRHLLLAKDAVSRADGLAESLATSFQLPQALLRVWSCEAEAESRPWRLAPDTAPALRAFLQSQMRPVCLPLSADQAGLVYGELGLPQERQGSMALLPLRAGISPDAFGLLLLTSPDPDRFGPGLGTAFLERIGEQASAALSELGRGPANSPGGA